MKEETPAFLLGLLLGALTAVVVQMKLEKKVQRQGDIVYDVHIPQEEM